jgi:hypothetical protein
MDPDTPSAYLAHPTPNPWRTKRWRVDLLRNWTSFLLDVPTHRVSRHPRHRQSLHTLKLHTAHFSARGRRLHEARGLTAPRRPIRRFAGQSATWCLIQRYRKTRVAFQIPQATQSTPFLLWSLTRTLPVPLAECMQATNSVLPQVRHGTGSC